MFHDQAPKIDVVLNLNETFQYPKTLELYIVGTVSMSL